MVAGKESEGYGLQRLKIQGCRVELDFMWTLKSESTYGMCVGADWVVMGCTSAAQWGNELHVPSGRTLSVMRPEMTFCIQVMSCSQQQQQQQHDQVQGPPAQLVPLTADTPHHTPSTGATDSCTTIRGEHGPHSPTPLLLAL